jgi:flagellar protein FlaG
MTKTENVATTTQAQHINPVQDQMVRAVSARAEAEKRAKIAAAVQKLADVANASNVELSFSVDQSSDQIVVKVTDANTGKVIRQIPSEEMLRLSRNIKEMIGLFYDHSA